MKINKNLLNFFKSTSTVLALSGLCGLAFHLLNHNFWASFILAFFFQYALFAFIGNIINSYFSYKLKETELDKLENLSSILECAFCAKPNVVTFFPNQNERFEFECEECKNKNVVNLNFTVARVMDFKDPLTVAPTIPKPTSPL
jgi:hypothetical protein